jgi:azurin
VETVFVPSTLATPEFISPLVEAGLVIIAPINPSAGMENQWMATIQTDFQGVLQDVWGAMLAGEVVPEIDSALQITHLNETLISSGRAELVQQIADELQSGFITTGISETD